MGCPSCGRGFHSECETGCDTCHPNIERLVIPYRGDSKGELSIGKGAPTKDPENVKDPFSTGRKRAAKMYPIFKAQPCEWRGKKDCGGGVNPIVGCLNGFQRDRHHGPVKSPLRNEPGNVHRICKDCHNRWHAKNDPEYIESKFNELPHNPSDATTDELMANELYWRTK